MKKENAFRKLLGITQDDMALLLGVSRSQWSMYELGKRDLPVAASVLLAELLQHLNEPVLSRKAKPQLEQYIDGATHLERLRDDNQYQQLLIARKIAAAEKKYIRGVRQLQVVDFLTRRPTNKQAAGHELLKVIAKKASQLSETEGLALLMELQLQQEFLVMQGDLLQSKVQKVDN